MDQRRWQQIDELFDEVLDLPETEVENFLAAKCGDDAELKKEVLSLLNSNKQSDSFLQKSAMKIAAHNLASEESVSFESNLLKKQIDTYKIEKLLGAGGMGEVYLADDEKLKRKVALKILPAEYVSNDERIKRFQLEARVISALNHPNIVTIYDIGSFEQINYIATEYVEGKTVREVIGSHLKLKDVLGIIIQCCEALSAAHDRGIIHRDIKPENIIIRPDGYIKILDFGLAKLSDIDLNTLKNFDKTAKGVIIGTPAYMSPEQVADEKVDHRTDLWSIGVVLYELLTGVNPFKKENRQTTFQAILSADPPVASSINGEIPPELDQILIKALEKDADLSYQTASDLRADLKRIKREIDSSPSWSSQSAARKNESRKKTNYVAYSVAAVILLLAGISTWFFVAKSNGSTPRQAIEWKNAQNLQLTYTPGVDGYPSLSPDGKYVVFASDDGGNRNIYRLRVGGKNPDNLTPNTKANNSMPAFSPNGKYIAFRSDREPDGIYVMEETGENVHRISDLGFHPSWSPDNKKVVVSDKAAAIHTVHSVPNSSLWVIDSSNGTKQKIETKGDAIMPNWSPNGNRIAFWFVEEGKLPEIATIPAEGGTPVVIASDASSDWNPVWSPDGKFLYFASDRGGNMNFWRVAIDEKTGQQMGEPESISTPSKYCRHITFSRDGKILAYVRYESQSNLQAIPFDPQTLKTNGAMSWITKGDREIGSPDLSPIGEEYVVRQPTRTQEDLAIFDKTGENWRTLMDDKFRDRVPHWTPDGKRIAFHTDRSGKFQIWTINPDGSDPQQITFSEKTGASHAVLSPDGNQLAYTETDGNKQSSFIIDLTKPWAEQTPKPLAINSTDHNFSVRGWSKDGKRMLLIHFESDGDENGIAVFNLETSAYEKMSDTGTNPVWLNDNRHFIYTDNNAVFLCDSQTKKSTELYKAPAYELQHANVSPDNKFIYFRYLQVNGDVWALDASQQNQ